MEIQTSNPWLRTCNARRPPVEQRNLVLVAVSAFLVFAQDSVAADHLENVRLRLVNGSSIRATINAIDEQGKVDGSRILKNVTLDQIVSLETGRKSADAGPEKIVHLHSGAFFPFSDIRIEDEQLEIISTGKRKTVPLELVRAIVWQIVPVVESTMTESAVDKDSVIVQTRRGDRVVRGLIESVDETHVGIFYDGESKRILRDKIKAIVPAELEVTAPNGTMASIQLIDGSLIYGVITSSRDNELNVALSDKYEMAVDADTVATISVETGRMVWLSDLEPIREQQQTQFVAARPWQRDKSLLGNPIRLKFNSSSRIHEFEKGIGTRSYTALVFRNANDFTHFRAVVGIDVETEGYGDCEMIVEGDGIRLWSARIRATDDPEPVVIEIAGMKEIALIVVPGENFDLADHADWADARFTKSD